MSSCTQYIVIRDSELYTVDEIYQSENIILYTYLDPNGVNVLVGMSIPDAKEYKCVFTRECTVISFDGYNDSPIPSTIEINNNIQIHRNQFGDVVRVLACDGIHNLRKYYGRLSV